MREGTRITRKTLEGTFKLKKQVSNIGFYAEVRLELNRTSDNEVVIDFGRFAKWSSAITFGAHYFFDHYLRTEEGGLKLTILNLRDMDFDTNDMVVFYVVVNALCHAIDTPCNLTINESGNFVIPK